MRTYSKINLKFNSENQNTQITSWIFIKLKFWKNPYQWRDFNEKVYWEKVLKYSYFSFKQWIFRYYDFD